MKAIKKEFFDLLKEVVEDLEMSDRMLPGLDLSNFPEEVVYRICQMKIEEYKKLLAIASEFYSKNRNSWEEDIDCVLGTLPYDLEMATAVYMRYHILTFCDIWNPNISEKNLCIMQILRLWCIKALNYVFPEEGEKRVNFRTWEVVLLHKSHKF